MLKEEHKGKLCLVINGKGEVFSDMSDLLKKRALEGFMSEKQ
jgi:hypothetical protein